MFPATPRLSIRPQTLFALLLSGSLLVSCGGSNPDGASSTNDGGQAKSDERGRPAGGIAPAPGSTTPGGTVIQLPMRTDGPKSTDPINGSTVYDNIAAVQVYETLLQHKYLVRPPQLEPLLLTEMPVVSEDGLTYSFKLKKGVMFHDNACFPDGKGREMVAGDVIYSWKRMANNDNTPKGWWLYKDTIKGFDAYRETQNADGHEFDYDVAVEGLRLIDDYTFEVELTRPVYRFMWLLSMFQTSVLPREAVEHYGETFGLNPVGTGPFLLDSWEPGKNITFVRNPSYRDERYPSEHMPGDEKLGFHLAAGKRLPIADRIEMTMYVQEQPMWLQFESGKNGYVQVPAEYFTEAYVKRTRKLRPAYVKRGIVSHAVKLLDFIFRGFNMEDDLVGGYSDKKRMLRQAINLSQDWDERNQSFYNGINIVYDGMIPPGLDGYPTDGKSSLEVRGPNLELARELLAKAGYPNGEGLPPIDFYTSIAGNGAEQAELVSRQVAEIGVKLNVRLVNFSQLINAVDNKKAPYFSFAWSSDYPDGENNLALFYGPNEAPGSNHYNFKNDEYDRLYEKIQVMPPSPERTVIYEQMRDMILEQAVYTGSMARTRFYLVNPWLKNFKPSEDFYNWLKYLDVDDSKRPQ